MVSVFVAWCWMCASPRKSSFGLVLVSVPVGAPSLVLVVDVTVVVSLRLGKSILVPTIPYELPSVNPSASSSGVREHNRFIPFNLRTFFLGRDDRPIGSGNTW